MPALTVVAGTRPNFVKVGPVIRALRPRADVRLVHTGQHADDRMSTAFFDDLDLPRPDAHLDVGHGSHAEVTAAVLTSFERDLQAHRPDAVVVVGDVTSTLAAALAAVKLHLPVAHLEAGLRARDWEMPEEVNRVCTDRISRWLLTPSADADANLHAEGVPPEWVHLVGNVVIDTLVANLAPARRRREGLVEQFDLPARYGVATIHRPSNVDDPADLARSLDILGDVARLVPLVVPMHPRTAARLDEQGLEVPTGVWSLPPLGYLDFIGLLDSSELCLTDSGGVQEETTVLGVPCLTMRTSTERPITCSMGTNTLVGLDRDAILAGAEAGLATPRTPATVPLWDGHAGQRAADVLLADLAT